MKNKSELTFSGLVQYLMEYESDTFSAEGSEITKAEAERVAMRMLKWFIDNRLDGCMIDDYLFDIR